MSLPVLLFLSLWTAQCGGCGSDVGSVDNIKTTIDMNAKGFRSVFPKDYYIKHRYTRRILCDDPCCVFPAAIVLLDSWHVLIKNLYDEHINRSLIRDLKQTLEKIIKSNRNTERFQEVTDLDQLSLNDSRPEELLNFTSELFSRWIEVRCAPSIETCSPSTLPPAIERKDYDASRAQLKTTRGIDEWEILEDEEINFMPELSSGGRLSVPYSVSLCSPLLFRLYWWLL
ncbi:hypothetical protein NQD34_012332 [Periophthalmus magnuspinnatus]|uniref:uncharacterized protein zgc:174888 n=1 Tax=Periophthalmus magnuspinnatus TaxID=409849 RepID=UPI00145B91BF|nr:uncharacterized protein zgc:174888 [Periophthalmus magnuspinnatus]KAJ0000490.1 hypothetical protein NQD34_012332 [Periophthalmus magnuspinnatus]